MSVGWYKSIVRMLMLMGMASLVACGEDEPIPTPGFEAEPPPERTRSFNPSDDLYDAEGNLREGDEVIVGLTMPRGLDKQDRPDERHHVYYTSLPIEKVVRYFGPRLFTGAVTQRRDGGAIYRGARPVGVTENVVRLDVSVLTAGLRTRVDIHELGPIPENPPSPAELQRRWDEMQRRLD